MGTSCEILFSENQVYAPELWNSNYVKRFPTLEDAVTDYSQRTNANPDPRDKPPNYNELIEIAKQNFPSYFNS